MDFTFLVDGGIDGMTDVTGCVVADFDGFCCPIREIKLLVEIEFAV